jgi:oxygen-independent coproporphyrinogen-3 oxidase
VIPGVEQAAEHLMMGLRVTDGIDLDRHARLVGRPLDPEAIAALANSGLLHVKQGRLRTTAQGRMLLNRIIPELLGA